MTDIIHFDYLVQQNNTSIKYIFIQTKTLSYVCEITETLNNESMLLLKNITNTDQRFIAEMETNKLFDVIPRIDFQKTSKQMVSKEISLVDPSVKTNIKEENPIIPIEKMTRIPITFSTEKKISFKKPEYKQISLSPFKKEDFMKHTLPLTDIPNKNIHSIQNIIEKKIKDTNLISNLDIHRKEEDILMLFSIERKEYFLYEEFRRTLPDHFDELNCKKIFNGCLFSILNHSCNYLEHFKTNLYPNQLQLHIKTEYNHQSKKKEITECFIDFVSSV